MADEGATHEGVTHPASPPTIQTAAHIISAAASTDNLPAVTPPGDYFINYS